MSFSEKIEKERRPLYLGNVHDFDGGQLTRLGVAPLYIEHGENQSKTSLKIRKRKHTHTQLDQVLCLQLFHFSNVHIITTQTRVSETWGCKCAAHVPAYMYNSHFYFKRVGRPSRGVDSEKLPKTVVGGKEELRGSLRVT